METALALKLEQLAQRMKERKEVERKLMEDTVAFLYEAKSLSSEMQETCVRTLVNLIGAATLPSDPALVGTGFLPQATNGVNTSRGFIGCGAAWSKNMQILEAVIALVEPRRWYSYRAVADALKDRGELRFLVNEHHFAGNIRVRVRKYPSVFDTGHGQFMVRNVDKVVAVSTLKSTAPLMDTGYSTS